MCVGSFIFQTDCQPPVYDIFISVNRGGVLIESFRFYTATFEGVLVVLNASGVLCIPVHHTDLRAPRA